MFIACNVCVTGSEIGMRNWSDDSCVAVRDGRVAVLMDVQVGQHNSTAHVHGFSHLKREADDCDIVRWHQCCCTYIRVGNYIKRVHTSLWALVWVFGCSTFDCAWLWAIDPLLQLPPCLLRSGTITRKGSVLYLFNCKYLRSSQAP